MKIIWQSEAIKNQSEFNLISSRAERVLWWLLVDVVILASFILNLQRRILPRESYEVPYFFSQPTSWSFAEWILVCIVTFVFLIHILNYLNCLWRLKILSKSPTSPQHHQRSPVSSSSSPALNMSNMSNQTSPLNNISLGNTPFSIQKGIPPLFASGSLDNSIVTPSNNSWNELNPAYVDRNNLFGSPSSSVPVVWENSPLRYRGSRGGGEMPAVDYCWSPDRDFSPFLDSVESFPMGELAFPYLVSQSPQLLTNNPVPMPQGYQIATATPPKPCFSPSHLTASVGNNNMKIQRALSYEAHPYRTSALNEGDIVDILADQYWSENGVSVASLDRWTLNLRRWIHSSIIKRIVDQIDVLNNQSHLVFGSNEIKIGEASLDTLRQVCQSQQATFYPGLVVLVRFLDCTSDQAYLVNRLRELIQSSCLGDYRWNAGSASLKAPWREHLPNDSTLLLHMFVCYMNTQLPWEPGQAGVGTFSHSRLVTSLSKGEMPASLEGVALYEVNKQPPLIRVVQPKQDRRLETTNTRQVIRSEGRTSISNAAIGTTGSPLSFSQGNLNSSSSTAAATTTTGLLINNNNNLTNQQPGPLTLMQYLVPEGRKNLYHALLLFLHVVLKKEGGRISGINLNSSGINVAWIFDS